jgi:hypothetical protein
MEPYFTSSIQTRLFSPCFLFFKPTDLVAQETHTESRSPSYLRAAIQFGEPMTSIKTILFFFFFPL